MHPAPGTPSPGAALITRPSRAARIRIPLAPASAKPKASRARERLRGGPELAVEVRVGRQDLIQDVEEAVVFGEGAGCGRDLAGGPNRQVGVGRVGGEVGEEVGF